MLTLLNRLRDARDMAKQAGIPLKKLAVQGLEIQDDTFILTDDAKVTGCALSGALLALEKKKVAGFEVALREVSRPVAIDRMAIETMRDMLNSYGYSATLETAMVFMLGIDGAKVQHNDNKDLGEVVKEAAQLY